MFEHKLIRDYNGQVYSPEQFLQHIKYYQNLNFNAYVGSDSKIDKNKITLVSVICFHQDGKSGKIFYLKEKVNKKEFPNLRTRMLLEAFRSLEVADELQKQFYNYIEIHLDIGDSKKSKTALYEKELQSLIRSQDYPCLIKPNSFASFIADKILKN